MNEEEKKAIEDLKGIDITYFVNGHECANFYLDEADKVSKEIELILNLIEKQQKELNSLKEIEQAHKTDNGLLRQELDMQIEHNKELEATLKQTQDSWFEDTQKLEQEKEKNKELEAKRIWNKLRIEELKKELVQEKEKNKELEEKLKIAKQLYNDSCICIATECVEKDKIKDMMKYREFELQQEYKEFEEDVEWRTYRKILEEK